MLLLHVVAVVVVAAAVAAALAVATVAIIFAVVSGLTVIVAHCQVTVSKCFFKRAADTAIV